MRQIITFIFILFASLMANAGKVKIDRFTYTLNNETKTAAISYDGRDLSGDIVIPSKVNYNDCTYIVTTIEKNAFRNCSSLTSVTIGDSVTSIGYGAFQYCDSLTSVSIGSSVSSIDSGAFYNCYNLKYVYITDLAAWCNIDFYEVSSTLFYHNNYSKLYLNGQEVKDLVIPDSVTTIRKYAFYKYKNLRSLVIPNSVTSIGKYAFYDCGYLKSVTIGSSVASIANNAFTSIYAQKAIWLANTPPENARGAKINYVSNDQFKFKNQKVYPFISSKFEVDNVVYVPVSPSERTCDVIDCNYNSSSKTVKIDSLVTNRNIQLKVLNVNPYAFYNNDSINEIIINNYDSIGDYAFADCYMNGALTIGRSVTSIGSNAFYRNRKLKDVVIPDNITNVGSSAFVGCSSLKSVKIGTGIDILNESLFSSCSSLSSIIIPNSINSISSYVFLYCDSLQYVIFSDALDTEKSKINISTSLFKGCPLVDVYIGRKLSYDTSSKSGYSPFYCNKTLRSVKITDKETTIYNNEFYGCTNLTSFEYGKNVTTIGAYAFYGASSLRQFVIQDSVINVGKFAFAGCSSLESVKFGKGIKSLNESLFDGCKSLEDIIIPSNISSIGNNAFKGCSTLGDVTFEDSYSKITLGYNSGSSPLFADCPLDEVYIGRKLSYYTGKESGYSPFYGNKTLRSVKITDAETKISDNEFYGCSNMQSFECGDGVTKIGNWAFSGCSAMKSYASGSKVESIGKEAFSDCTSLTSFTSMAAVPPTCGDQALDDINKWECTLYIPVESKDEYMAAPQWKEFFFIEESGIDDITADGDNCLDFSKSASGITLNNAADARVEVYGLDGRLCRAIPAYAGEEIALNRGVYIVRVNGKSLKIAI